MAQQQQSSGKKWFMACGIGCLVLIVIGILVGVGIFIAARMAMTKGTQEAVKMLVSEYDSAKGEGKVPAEHAALYDGLLADAQAEGTSLWKIVIISAAVGTTFDDGAVSEEELARAQAVRDFLKEHPEVGMMDLGRFMEEHPEMQAEINEIQQKYSGQ